MLDFKELPEDGNDFELLVERYCGHFLRVRALHFDDKYTMYLDYLIPRDEDEPEYESYLETTVEEIEKFDMLRKQKT